MTRKSANFGDSCNGVGAAVRVCRCPWLRWLPRQVTLPQGERKLSARRKEDCITTALSRTCQLSWIKLFYTLRGRIIFITHSKTQWTITDDMYDSILSHEFDVTLCKDFLFFAPKKVLLDTFICIHICIYCRIHKLTVVLIMSSVMARCVLQCIIKMIWVLMFQYAWETSSSIFLFTTLKPKCAISCFPWQGSSLSPLADEVFTGETAIRHWQVGNFTTQARLDFKAYSCLLHLKPKCAISDDLTKVCHLRWLNQSVPSQMT